MYIDIRIILLSLLFIICCYSSNTKIKEGLGVKVSTDVTDACKSLKDKNNKECEYDEDCGTGDSNYWSNNCNLNFNLSRTCHNSDKYNTQCGQVRDFNFLKDN